MKLIPEGCLRNEETQGSRPQRSREGMAEKMFRVSDLNFVVERLTGVERSADIGKVKLAISDVLVMARSTISMLTKEIAKQK
ncbi:MAG: hypothetical protein Nk1A_6820 [Endomicrobiia bacterium]|nr:MAG: hypothetical protein Nk1A_6650 [Endomicrobiia bacterium]GMO68178.1 MAG: hypothetical protein Nk1A_6820 [Endomicrobiia bacterium]